MEENSEDRRKRVWEDFINLPCTFCQSFKAAHKICDYAEYRRCRKALGAFTVSKEIYEEAIDMYALTWRRL